MSEVKYGDKIRLNHKLTNHKLHSHDLNYFHSGTSGQQQVTCYGGGDDNDYWFIEPGHGDSVDQGTTMYYGDTFTLVHMLTKKRLHSHSGIKSPVTGQQEVTCYGGGDTNDNWQCTFAKGQDESVVLYGDYLRFYHPNSKINLHSHDLSSTDYKGFNVVANKGQTMYQNEVTGYGGFDDNDLFCFV